MPKIYTHLNKIIIYYDNKEQYVIVAQNNEQVRGLPENSSAFTLEVAHLLKKSIPLHKYKYGNNRNIKLPKYLKGKYEE